MLKHRGGIQRSATAGLATMILLFTFGSSSAWADRGPDCHAGMGMSGHGMHGGWGHGMRWMKPHNAAEHFLKMGQYLKLTDSQVTQLTKLRDEYIEKNATTEQQLKVANEDLGRALHGDSVDMKTVNALLEKIGKMEGQLWRAYALQLHDIKAMLTADQKQSLKSMWRDGHHGMYGHIPMDRDDDDDRPMMKQGIGM